MSAKNKPPQIIDEDHLVAVLEYLELARVRLAFAAKEKDRLHLALLNDIRRAADEIRAMASNAEYKQVSR